MSAADAGTHTQHTLGTGRRDWSTHAYTALSTGHLIGQKARATTAWPQRGHRDTRRPGRCSCGVSCGSTPCLVRAAVRCGGGRTALPASSGGVPHRRAAPLHRLGVQCKALQLLGLQQCTAPQTGRLSPQTGRLSKAGAVTWALHGGCMPHLEAQFGPLNKKRSQAKKTNEFILSVFPAAVAALTPPSAQTPAVRICCAGTSQYLLVPPVPRPYSGQRPAVHIAAAAPVQAGPYHPVGSTAGHGQAAHVAAAALVQVAFRR